MFSKVKGSIHKAQRKQKLQYDVKYSSESFPKRKKLKYKIFLDM